LLSDVEQRRMTSRNRFPYSHAQKEDEENYAMSYAAGK
jgi:hypothetical protein